MKDYKKLHEPVGRVQFVVFENFTSGYLFQITREKSFDYLLIDLNNIQVTISVKLQYFTLRDKWRQQATPTLLDENLTCK